MALANYTDLQASVATWLNRTDLTAVIPDFIALAESDISRDLRLRKQITSGTLSTVANTRGVALPADWLGFENVSLLISPARQLSYVTVEQLDSVYPSNGGSGSPSLFTIEGDNVLFGQTPDGVYTVSILYYAKFAALATASTNWLLTNHPQVYLHGALKHACIYLKDRDRAADYYSLYKKLTDELQAQDDDAQHGGSVMRVRTL